METLNEFDQLPWDSNKSLGDFMTALPSLQPVLGKRGVETNVLTEDWYIAFKPLDYIDLDSVHSSVRAVIEVIARRNKFFLKIPKGASTNYGTISSALRVFLSKVDPVIYMGSIAHDYLVGEFESAPAALTDILYIRDAKGNMVSVMNPDGDDKNIYEDWDDIKSLVSVLLQSNVTTDEANPTLSWITAAKVFLNIASMFAGRTAWVKRLIAYAGILLHGWIKGKI